MPVSRHPTSVVADSEWAARVHLNKAPKLTNLTGCHPRYLSHSAAIYTETISSTPAQQLPKGLRDLGIANQKRDVLSASSMADFAIRYASDIGKSLHLAWRRWVLDDVASLSAAVAYYLALSVFPMLLLLSSGIGLFLKYTNLGHDAELHILSVVHEHCSPSLEAQVRMLLLQFEDQSVVGSEFGLIASIAAAIGVFYQFDQAFDKIWRIPKSKHSGFFGFVSKLLGKRLMAFLMLGCVGLTIVAIMIANIAITAVRDWMVHLHLPGTVLIAILDATTTLILNTIAFGVLYRSLPKKKVLWRDAFRSGLLVAVVWEVAREFLFTFMIGMRYTTTYGAIGSFIALLLWFYWGVSILFFGAEYLQVLSMRHQRPLKMFDSRNYDDAGEYIESDEDDEAWEEDVLDNGHWNLVHRDEVHRDEAHRDEEYEQDSAGGDNEESESSKATQKPSRTLRRAA